MASKRHPEELDPQLLGQLLEALVPIEPDPEQHARMRTRVLAAAAPDLKVIRGTGGAWLPLMDGVAIKPLRVDRAARTQTSLWRLAPGARVPSHEHHFEEECLILEGNVLMEGVEYQGGDYLLACNGSHHDEFESTGGALLLIRSELNAPLDALFQAAGF